ncbi:hypothetical protein BKA57DRAFT_459914 [Linnemannia elongata]|nr:hypothetical protein BKA57DRAFT_459914 [Linnemannia elongata]
MALLWDAFWDLFFFLLRLYCTLKAVDHSAIAQDRLQIRVHTLQGNCLQSTRNPERRTTVSSLPTIPSPKYLPRFL